MVPYAIESRELIYVDTHNHIVGRRRTEVRGRRAGVKGRGAGRLRDEV